MTNDVSTEAKAQLRAAVDTALASPGQAKGFLEKIPDLSAVGPKVLEVLDGVLGAIDTIQEYAWIIPDQYEAPIQKLEDALRRVRGWVS